MNWILFVTLVYTGFGIAAENRGFSNRKDCETAAVEFKDRAGTLVKVVAFCVRDGGAEPDGTENDAPR